MTLPVDQQSLLFIGAAAIVLLLSMLALLFGWLYFSQRRLLQQQNEDWLHERGQLNQQLHDAQQKQQHQSQLLAQQHSQFMVAKSQLEASQQQLQQSQNQVQQQQQQSNTLQEQRQQLQLQLQQQQIINEQQQSHYQQQIELLEQTKTRLSQEFELLANKIFEQKQAQSSAHNKEQIAHLLAPFAQQLHEFKAKVDATHLNDSKDRSALLTEIKHLQSLNQRITEEASKLTSALKGEKKLQGNWGELILETVLERSGLRRGHR